MKISHKLCKCLLALIIIISSRTVMAQAGFSGWFEDIGINGRLQVKTIFEDPKIIGYPSESFSVWSGRTLTEAPGRVTMGIAATGYGWLDSPHQPLYINPNGQDVNFFSSQFSRLIVNGSMILGSKQNVVTGTLLTVAGATYIGAPGFDPAQASIKSGNLDEYLLWVEKGIVAEDVALAKKADWADFVFETGYQLKPLSEVESFVKKNRHLPNFPSAKQVSEEGYTIHDMNKRFLKQVEELTLHAIAQEKEIDQLKEQLKAYQKLAAEVAALKAAIK